MQKKTLIILFVAFLFAGNVLAREGDTIPLVAPQKTGGMPLFEALNNRQSIRSFSPEELSRQDLSNLLWAAFGVNREDGRRRTGEP